VLKERAAGLSAGEVSWRYGISGHTIASVYRPRHAGTFRNLSLCEFSSLRMQFKALSDGTYQSIEELASAAKWNPKVIRKVLRLAFLAPDITEAIIIGTQPKSLSVSVLQGISAHSWVEQRRLVRSPVAT
jgi:hypothetical protein